MAKKNRNNVEEVTQSIDNTAELEARIAELEAKLAAVPKNRGSVRKFEVLAILRNGPAAIKTIATELNTTTRNVSSVLTGLKKSGCVIHTDEQLRKYLVSEPEATTALQNTTMPESDDIENSETENNGYIED